MQGRPLDVRTVKCYEFASVYGEYKGYTAGRSRIAPTLTKERDCMKKKTLFAIILLIALVAALFPIPTIHNISGAGEVLNLQKEKIGTCELEVEINVISSLAICYKRSFSFILNGKPVETFSTTSYSEADGLCLHSQMY